MSARRSRATVGTVVAAIATILVTSGRVETAASSGAAKGSELACPATGVEKVGRSTVVRAGPFVGHLTPKYDVVDGRFRLHVGPLRDPVTGLSQKIPWFLRGRPQGTTTALVVTGTRISPRPQRQFRQTFRSSSRRFWPTNISPPLRGCWRLQLRSGRVTGLLTVLVESTSTLPPPEQPSECTGGEVEVLTNGFLTAFNAGNFEELDRIFAQDPDFEWYVTAAPGERLQMGDRASLVPYFRQRHELGERLTLNSFRFNGNTVGSRTYGNFEYTLTRRANDLAPTAYVGKGAALCFRSRSDQLIVWAMGASA